MVPERVPQKYAPGVEESEDSLRHADICGRKHAKNAPSPFHIGDNIGGVLQRHKSARRQQGRARLSMSTEFDLFANRSEE